MKKTTSIRLSLIIAALVCGIAYGSGYYFSVRQSEKRLARELALEQEQLLAENDDQEPEVTESAVGAATCEYVLGEEEGYIIVYYADKETVYSNTDIRIEELPSGLQKEISGGKPVYSEGELYDFLESYSS